jgi:hypothetical protein
MFCQKAGIGMAASTGTWLITLGDQGEWILRREDLVNRAVTALAVGALRIVVLESLAVDAQ